MLKKTEKENKAQHIQIIRFTIWEQSQNKDLKSIFSLSLQPGGNGQEKLPLSVSNAK